MYEISAVVQRAKRFRVSVLVAESGISRRHIYDLLDVDGSNANPLAKTMNNLVDAVERLEARVEAGDFKILRRWAREQALMPESQNSQNADEKQTQSTGWAEAAEK